MDAFVVTVEVDLVTEPTDDQIDQLLDSLAPAHGAVSGRAGNRRVSATFDVVSDTLQNAGPFGFQVFSTAASAARLGAADLVSIHALTVEAQEQLLGEPPIPELVGAAEAADLLGISRQRVHQLSHRADFPRPVTQVRMGPLWLRHSIEAFASYWSRKSGRPSKATTAPRQETIAAKRDVWTFPHGDGWANRREGSERVAKIFKTKAEASAAGKRAAKRDGVEHFVASKTTGQSDAHSRIRNPRSTKG